MDSTSVCNEMVRVEAEVEVVPDAQVAGKVQTCYVGPPTLNTCPDDMPSDTFIVSQLICVKIPISFSANASVQPKGISCVEPCPVPERCNSEYDYPVSYDDRYGYKRSNDYGKPIRDFSRNYRLTYQNK